MKEVTFMADYFAVHMLAMAQKSECRFGECLMSCERTDDGVIKVEDRDVFERLLEHRIDSLLLSLAALEAYLGYYASRAAEKIELESPGVKVQDYFEKLDLLEMFKDQPNRVKRRHEIILEENRTKPMSFFLSAARLTIEEKIFYWPMIRTGQLISFKDGYVKKMIRVLNLREDLVVPATPAFYDMRKVGGRDEIADVFLRHEVPAGLTPGKSCSDEFATDDYGEEHFLWELLHYYPARTVREFIQYLHRLDLSDNHFITVMRQALVVNDKGDPLTEPEPRYRIEFNLEE